MIGLTYDSSSAYSYHNLFVLNAILYFQGKDHVLFMMYPDSANSKPIDFTTCLQKDDGNIAEYRNGSAIVRVFSELILYRYNISKRLYPDKLAFLKDRRSVMGEMQKAITKHIDKNETVWNENLLDFTYSRISNTPTADYARNLYFACLYLLRAHCSYWIEESVVGVDHNWAKSALNDLIQARYILNSIRRSIYDYSDDFAKYVSSGKGFDPTAYLLQSRPNGEHYQDIVSEACMFKNDDDMKYVLWLLGMLVDILSGNVYKKVHNDDASFDCYCRAIREFKRSDYVTSEIDDKLCEFIIDKERPDGSCVECPKGIMLTDDITKDVLRVFFKTLAKVRFEKAKIYFSQGLFLESLKWHTRAVMDLVIMSSSEMVKERQAILPQYCMMQKIIRFIDLIKEEPEFSRIAVFDLFSTLFIRHLCLLKTTVSPDYWRLLSDILPRIGYAMLTIRPLADQGDAASFRFHIPDELKLLFSPEKLFGDDYRNDFGDYCKKMYLPESDSKTMLFPDRIERYFSSIFLNRIRLTLNDSMRSKPENRLALQLGLVTIANIDNVVTLPQKIRSYFIRRGYIQGCGNYRDGKSTSKFVCLRRYQSFNPIIPRPHKIRNTETHVQGGGYFLIWNNKGIVIDPGFDFIQNFYDEGFSIQDIDAIIITHAHIDHDNELSSIITLLHEWNSAHRHRDQKLIKQIDLFLNKGSYRKYESLIYASNKIVRMIQVLDINGEWIERDNRTFFKSNGSHNVMDMIQEYGWSVEVLPARHPELIARDSAVGLKFVLYDNEHNRSATIGITGDTCYFEGIEEEYGDCDLLVAHLGDIQLREIRAMADIHFHLADFEGLQESLGIPEFDRKINELNEVLKLSDVKVRDLKSFINMLNAEHSYAYRNHLGIRGVYNIFMALVRAEKKANEKRDRILLISELPEELESYRHLLARLLNDDSENRLGEDSGSAAKKAVRCLTADIGLHIRLNPETKGTIQVRCERCNMNNELVKKRKHYHNIERIDELSIKQVNSKIVYLCSEAGHSLNAKGDATKFISHPVVRYI